MMASVVQVVQTVPVVPMVQVIRLVTSQGGPGGQVGWWLLVRWSGDQVVRVVRVATLDDMLLENIWFSCTKSSNN